MNQQRSRRFRSAQEAEDKETTRKEGIAIFEGEILSTNFAWVLTVNQLSERTSPISRSKPLYHPGIQMPLRPEHLSWSY